MSNINYKDQQALSTLVSEEFSDWSDSIRLEQSLIDQYAALSGDDMWLHTEVERCTTESPFGSTIAHGLLILSLLPKIKSGEDKLQRITGFGHMMNYGSDRLRFLEAVPVDSEIHSRSRIKRIEVSAEKTKVVMEIHVNIAGSDTPALICEMMFVYI